MADLDRLPLTGLRAAEAVGRLGSLSRAAQELSITAGAVSQRITKLEALIGRPLFHRLPGGMVPTDLGAEMMVPLSRAMGDLGHAVALAGAAHHTALTISVAPLFASRWLVWRLGRFQALHPGIRVRVDPGAALADPLRGEADVCLRAGRGRWPGVTAEQLAPHRVFPVCAPALAPRLRGPGDLVHVPIIREGAAMDDWAVWLTGTGVSPDDLAPGPVYADGGLCLDVAMTGQGVFLAWEKLAMDALDRAQVVEPFARRAVTPAGLWFVTAPGADRRPPVRLLRDWLRAELEPLA